MTYVVTGRCVGHVDQSCVAACPADCIVVGRRMSYIDPDRCIDCNLCAEVCPYGAIYEEELLPSSAAGFLAINAEFFRLRASNPSIEDHPATLA